MLHFTKLVAWLGLGFAFHTCWNHFEWHL